MARFVREDATQADLRQFVLREVVGKVRGHDVMGEINACFLFARDGITYRADPYGVERVADLWSTLYALNPNTPEGDCGIKSVFLATCLALVGRPVAFTVIKQTPADDGFTHVYVNAQDERGSWLALDPTPQDRPAGWKPPRIAEGNYQIFK